MKRIYWIGPRESDIDCISSVFKGSVTIYGSNKNGNISYCSAIGKRINHNIPDEDCDLFFKKTLEEIVQHDSNAQLLFYNPKKAYSYGQTIVQHSIGLNDYSLLEQLDDKTSCRWLLNEQIKAIPSIVLQGEKCVYQAFLAYFKGYTEFVVQHSVSSGGEGTFLITSDNAVDILSTLDNHARYLVSPYLKDAIPLNTHMIIYGDAITHFPSSVQIIDNESGKLLYKGADFACYQTLSHTIHEMVFQSSKTIGFWLGRMGYRGIVGIDFLLKDGLLYFVEINPRFQASSELINRALMASNADSLQKLHLDAFDVEAPIKKDVSLKISMSNYSYSNGDIALSRIAKMMKSDEVEEIQWDGFEYNGHDSVIPAEEGTYLFRVIFKKNICALQNSHILIHPNINIEKVKRIILNDRIHFMENIKIALLNQGVTLSSETEVAAKKDGVIRDAVFDAIDLTVFNGLQVNVPKSCKFNTISPFTIDIFNNEMYLYMDDIKISKARIDMLPTALQNRYTSTNVPFLSIINLATDRIRINPAPVCIYKLKDSACRFCNLPIENDSYTLTDVFETIDYCLKHVDFRHFLIGGGTIGEANGWEVICQIAKFIRDRCNKDIYLMSIPPKDISVLRRLKDSGITEVAFNLEIFDRDLAANIMPGKGKIPYHQYMDALEESVRLWGTTGNVRSLLILGLDSEKAFLAGIEKLCRMGVEPIISIFRPLKGTDLEDLNPPATEYIFNMYRKSVDIASRYHMILGPDCPACQNNTLSFTKPKE